MYLVSIIMDTEIATPPAIEGGFAPPAEQQPAPADNRRLRGFELGLVLLVAFGNFFLNSFSYFAGVRAPIPANSSQNMRWTAALIQEAIALLLLGYVLSRRKLRIRDLGLRWSFRELRPGVLVAVASYTAYTVGYLALNALHRRLFGSAARDVNLHSIFGFATIMMLVFSLLNPFFEELIVRAYLMTEVKNLTGSWFLAALVSTAVQISYHIYYGWTMALALGFQFLVFSIYYARTQRAMPVVFAHGVFDFIGVFQLI